MVTSQNLQNRGPFDGKSSDLWKSRKPVVRFFSIISALSESQRQLDVIPCPSNARTSAPIRSRPETAEISVFTASGSG